MSSVQMYSYGAWLRLVTDSSVLLLTKSQVKTIEIIRDDTIKISLGNGTLQELLIKLAEVTIPAGLPDVAALRDTIAHMLDHANLFEEKALIKHQLEIDQLIEIKQVLNLWHSSQQIDLNFQQLQVNALVAIGNRLLEAKENDERLINNVTEQTNVVKAQSLQLSGLENLITAIRAANESALSKQDNTYNVLSDIKVTDGLIKTILADILNELKAQTNLLNPISTTLNDIRSQNTTTHNKLDNHSQLLTEIKVILSNQHS
jgi:hypothetical protein